MRLGLLSDIHANLPALTRVLELLAREQVDAYVCAGDLVGYGPHPNECVEAIAACEATCVAGNHDLIATERLTDDGIGELARETLSWTASQLLPCNVRYVRGLPLVTCTGHVIVAHGSLDDPSAHVTPERAREQLDRLRSVGPAPKFLVLGHTHRPLAYGLRSGMLLWGDSGTVHFGSFESLLINPGSVGQSRERRAVARFAVLDLDQQQVEFRHTRYNRTACRRALRQRGLPPRSYHRSPTSARARLGRMRRRAGELLSP
jgi:predicted phosphodiesterase